MRGGTEIGEIYNRQDLKVGESWGLVSSDGYNTVKEKYTIEEIKMYSKFDTDTIKFYLDDEIRTEIDEGNIDTYVKKQFVKCRYSKRGFLPNNRYASSFVTKFILIPYEKLMKILRERRFQLMSKNIIVKKL